MNLHSAYPASRGASVASERIRGLLRTAVEHSAATATRRAASDADATMGDVYAAVQTLPASTLMEAKRILKEIRHELQRHDLSSAPAMHPACLDDGSVVVEWAFEGRRLALSFDPKPGESGWFFLSSREFGDVRVRGRFDDFDAAPMLSMVLYPSSL